MQPTCIQVYILSRIMMKAPNVEGADVTVGKTSAARRIAQSSCVVVQGPLSTGVQHAVRAVQRRMVFMK